MTQNDILEETDTEELIFTDNDSGIQQIKGATLDRLFQRLTYQRGHNVEDSQVFVLHYDKFFNAEELMTRLLDRFRSVIIHAV